MAEVNELTELLRPHVGAIQQAAMAGNHHAQEVMSLYKMHCSCPSDPGAPALCRAAFEAWQKEKTKWSI